jgi:predicted esterase
MPARAALFGIKFEPPHMPQSLLQLIQRDDVAASPHDAAANPSSNPFYGKKILVLAGAKDKLVPWSASKNFVEKLHVGENGTKKVVVLAERGHECAPEMIDDAAAFIWNEA